ncbi:C-terminal binding protein [Actinomadura sp. 7K507]|uniref:C-terminal binding protein n=1 Tax=Actinomadura sp. 7K507 TaxID=2530365 RepID=UPI00104AB590|nr:C-terminal binding protein [Actinomadura sp. 7K507]TDC97598.1 C-terminal binding protein [Actinomadura sp. 7K507]
MSDLVVITDADLPGTERIMEILRAGGLRTRLAQCRTEDDVAEAAADATALVVQWAPVTAAVLDRLERCTFIGRLGIGYDMIDVEAASARGIAVANTPDYCVEEVAAHTIALVMAAGRRLFPLDRAVREHRWSVAEDAPAAFRPSRTTLGVVGFGRIGSRTAAHAAALGFRVVVHDPHVPGDAVHAAGHRPATLDQTLAAADIVSLHVPLTGGTRHLLDARSLARLPRGALVVNTCRGGLVDEAALAAAIRDRHLSGAALDVFETEPLPGDSPLRGLPGVILTPHAAWYSPQARADLAETTARQVVDFLNRRPVPSIVNPEYTR